METLTRPLRILNIALNNKRQVALCDALASMGPYLEIDWIEEVKQKGLGTFRNDLINTANEFRPDVIFCQLQNLGVIDPDTARQLPGFRINWTGDVRQPTPQWYIDLGKAIDLTLFTNIADVDTLRANGCSADYLQIGFDPNVFRKLPDVEKDIDIVFMGNNYGNMFPLSQLRSEMVNRLYAVYGDRFRVYGQPWPIPSQTVEHNTHAECEIYNRAKIGINLSHFDLGMYSSDRIHSIMGSGCFCLTKWYPGIEKEFEPANNIGIWRDLDELIELVGDYLKFDGIREPIAKAGYDLVHSRDTWQRRIEQLKTMLPI
jgi:spore maturation protein CgeB